MSLSKVTCPDCGRRVDGPLVQTVTGREVCADCADALRIGSSVGAITGSTAEGIGVWGMLMRRIRRPR